MKKRIIAIATALTVVAMIGGAGMAKATDVSDMSLSELQDLLSSIQAQIATLQGTSVVGASVTTTPYVALI